MGPIRIFILDDRSARLTGLRARRLSYLISELRYDIPHAGQGFDKVSFLLFTNMRKSCMSIGESIQYVVCFNAIRRPYHAFFGTTIVKRHIGWAKVTNGDFKIVHFSAG